ncbi:MAG: hypothetical protein EXS09_10400 [Gemmataceae bacterium]|nr:hypothetical protein [Gemmataceae bacterium]
MMLRMFLAAVAAFVVAGSVSAQGTLPAPAKVKVMATVNGRQITEAAVDRALRPVPKENWDKARPEVLSFLTENALVDNYLELLKIAVDPKDVDTQLDGFKKELVASKQDYAKALEKMEVTEAELKIEILNQIRWEKFVAQQGTDDKLKKLYESSPEIFDGSLVRARHILIAPETRDEAGKAATLKKITEIKGGIQTALATSAAKVPADADNLTKQKALYKAADDAFSEAARKHSTCPSKQDGGTLPEFPRMGAMVEPFAKAAFSLPLYQVSEPIGTQFGYHLILVTSKKPGEAVKFDSIKGAILEVYGTRLREAVIEKMKADPNTKIEYAKQ